MAPRSSSPSARFYAHRSAPNTPQLDQQQVTLGTQAASVHHTEPFGQFQGFSAPSTRQSDVHPHSGIYGYDTREADISPRMLVPNTFPRGTAPPRRQTFVQDDDDVGLRPQAHQVYSAIDSGINVDVVSQQNEAPTRQWLPSHQSNATCPPCVCAISTGPSRPLQGALRSHINPLPMSCATPRQHNTFHVPSDSEPSYLDGDSELSAFEASLADDLEGAAETAASMPSALGEGASTIYPEDSVSAISCAGAPCNDLSLESLVDFVVVVHDICLAATQRYLESLRTNWDLRNGRPTNSGEVEKLLGGRPVRTHERGPGDRWRPYTRSAPRRWENNEHHLEHMTMGIEGDQYQDDGGHYRPVLVQENPIPESTNSLLDNIRHICDLIWRRAQRDREDVLGAEAKGCQEMSYLYECGEAIVLYNMTDAAKYPQACWGQVMAAGTGICRGLGDWEGLRMIEMEHMGEDGQVMVE